MSSQFQEPQDIPLITISAFEIVLDRLVEILTLEEANQRVQAVNSGKSQGTLTLAKPPKDGDTILVDAKPYLFQDTLTDVDGNIQIGVDLVETQRNLVAAFNLSGVAGTDYAASMTPHPTVDIDNFNPQNMLPALEEAILTAKTAGVAGDAIVTTSGFTDAENLFDAATLGTTRAGSVVDPDDFGFTVTKEIHNPFLAFRDETFKVPLVNVFYLESEITGRSVTEKKNSANYSIDIYSQELSTETKEGMTISSGTCNRVIRQVLYILGSPKYINLRLAYQNAAGDLVKFIEKLSVTSIRKVFPEKPWPKENVVVAQMTFRVEMVETLFDLQGQKLEEILVQLEEPQ